MKAVIHYMQEDIESLKKLRDYTESVVDTMNVDQHEIISMLVEGVELLHRLIGVCENNYLLETEGTQQSSCFLKEMLIKHINEFEIPSEIVIDFGSKEDNHP